MKKIFILIIFLLIIPIAHAELADSPWPTFHGNLQRTGQSIYDTSHIDGTLKWKYNVGTGMESSPSLGSDETIYVGSHDGHLYAIKDGQLKWKLRLAEPITKTYADETSISSILGTATIGNDETIYIVSQHSDVNIIPGDVITTQKGFLHAVSSDGTEKWKFPMNTTKDYWGSPAIASDGTIYVLVSPPNGGLYALNTDGSIKWKYPISMRMFNSPSLDKDGNIYIATSVDYGVTKVISLDPSGKERWSVETEELESSPAISEDGTVYVGSFDAAETGAGLYSISLGKINWFYKVGGKEVFTTPAIANSGTIYFGSLTGYLYAMNPDGTEKWTINFGTIVESSVAIGAEGTLYFGVDAKERGEPSFYAVNPDGTIKWEFAPEVHATIPASPAIGKDGTVYVSSWDGYVYAFGEGGEVIEEPEDEIDYVPLDAPKDLHEEPEGERNFLEKIIDWIMSLFK